MFGEGPLAFEKTKVEKEKTPKKVVKSKYLAFALSWLGFDFTTDSKDCYIFEETKKFKKAWNEINKLRREIGEVK